MKIKRKQTKLTRTRKQLTRKPVPTAGPAEQRKLAVIMFTDMVGYSALTQRDEKLALRLLPLRNSEAHSARRSPAPC